MAVSAHRMILPALKSIQDHGWRVHEPATEAAMAAVVHEPERLGVGCQVLLVGITVFFEPSSMDHQI